MQGFKGYSQRQLLEQRSDSGREGAGSSSGSSCASQEGREGRWLHGAVAKPLKMRAGTTLG